MSATQKPERTLREFGYISTGEAAAMLGMKQGSNVDRLLAKNKVPVVEIPMGAKKRRMWLRDSVAVLARIKHPAEPPRPEPQAEEKSDEPVEGSELQRMRSEIAGLSARVAHLEALLMVHRKPDRQLRLA